MRSQPFATPLAAIIVFAGLASASATVAAPEASTTAIRSGIVTASSSGTPTKGVIETREMNADSGGSRGDMPYGCTLWGCWF
jgi:hypothetical protein